MPWESQPRPNQHASYDKHDVIEWGSLPPGECDMNYRLPYRGPDRDVLGLGLQISAAVFVGGLIWIGSLLLAEHWGRAVGGIAATLVLAAVAGLATQVTTRNRKEAASSFLLPLVLGGLVLFASMDASWRANLVAWLLLGWAGTLWLSDRVATTNLWWCSAHPRIPRAVMTAYRAAWAHRWNSRQCLLTADRPELAQLRGQTTAVLREYWLGAIWLGVTFVLGVAAGCISADITGVEAPLLLVLLQTTVLLVCAAWLRLESQLLDAFRLLGGALLRHAYEDDHTPKPPWVLRLPGGPAFVRWLSVQLIAVMIGFVLTPQVLYEVVHSPLEWTTAAAAVFLTPLLFGLAVCVAAGPTILAHHVALESPGFEQSRGSEWDGYVARLRESRFRRERCAIWFGSQTATGFPILVDRKLYFEHVHVVGATGSGKTALSIASDLTQLIRNNRGPNPAGMTLIIDCKGDNALFHTAREEAEAAGRTFKWFTNRPDHETYAFNPVVQLGDAGLSIAEQVGVIAQALSLYHGEGYGRGFFGGAAKALLRSAYESTIPLGGVGAARPPIESFRELEEAIGENIKSEQDRQLARQLLDTVGSLCSFPQLNLSGADAPGAYQHAIHLPTAIREGHVIYFYLTGVLDLASVGHLARLALYATIAAAADHLDKTGQSAAAHVFADEAQCLISKNVEVVLEQARSLGVSCVLAHQNLSQLDLPGGPDLRQLVQANTAVKRYHSARDPETQKYLAAVSGRTPYYDLTWDQYKGRVQEGKINPRYAFGKVNAQTVSVQQTLGDRLEAQDIADMNRHIEQSALVVERNEGLTQLNGALVIESCFPYDMATYKRREQAPWPSRPGETLVASSPACGPQPYPEFDDEELDRRMREVRDHLFPDE